MHNTQKTFPEHGIHVIRENVTLSSIRHLHYKTIITGLEVRVDLPKTQSQNGETMKYAASESKDKSPEKE